MKLEYVEGKSLLNLEKESKLGANTRVSLELMEKLMEIYREKVSKTFEALRRELPTLIWKPGKYGADYEVSSDEKRQFYLPMGNILVSPNGKTFTIIDPY